VCDCGKRRTSCFYLDHNIRFEESEIVRNRQHNLSNKCIYLFLLLLLFSSFSFHMSLKCGSYLFLFYTHIFSFKLYSNLVWNTMYTNLSTILDSKNLSSFCEGLGGIQHIMDGVIQF